MKKAALVSSVLVLPLAILELVHTTVTRHNAAGLIILFGLLWLLPTAMLSILTSRITLWLRVPSALVLAVIWTGLLVDQMPCFLGAPNCD